MTASASLPQHYSPWREEPGRPRPCFLPPLETLTRAEDLSADQPSSTEADRNDGAAGSEIWFGPFRLFPSKRLLLESGNPLPLGSRALDILIALVERAGELVTKSELMARVWPATIVVEDNLTVHMAALRRALGDGKEGKRYIITNPGRGYSFVAPVSTQEKVELRPPQLVAAGCTRTLPAPLTRLIGRADTTTRIADHLLHQRLLTIVGPGGIGKTSVARAVAERVMPQYDQGICMVDLALLGNHSQVQHAVAAALWHPRPSDDGPSAAEIALADQHTLLLLDNCEHVIDAVAEVAVNVLRDAPGVQILATSREPLRVEGEHVHRLSQLDFPPASAQPTAAEVLAFPAVQLFVERATANADDFELDDDEAPIVADICRRVDGVPLAIEFAAARVGALGVRGVAARMEDGLALLTSGFRMSPPRQQSMRATIEWSYGLLTEREQSVLRRLSIFADDFTLQAAAQAVAGTEYSESELIDIILGLVAKSLVMADPHGAEPRLRLLDMTRAFARIKLAESSESDLFCTCRTVVSPKDADCRCAAHAVVPAVRLIRDHVAHPVE